ncbi:hypothetical protein PGT21_012390 [Puccinia graminis f. sp. tritici]|uniref:Uncharacterized protein n=1 Tax=Puccinia graminis f. sp. tritici TaxID=56615 RepID=A0A5B0SHM9_PUCGR|nr:hypothetical protein PGT21_012390 [Puccinia graminis f. sp. tritici]KAA1136004.1 hypothetical protein PGTUg99_020433 [Puccinia graminis f. sp. tritici]
MGMAPAIWDGRPVPEVQTVFFPQEHSLSQRKAKALKSKQHKGHNINKTSQSESKLNLNGRSILAQPIHPCPWTLGSMGVHVSVKEWCQRFIQPQYMQHIRAQRPFSIICPRPDLS